MLNFSDNTVSNARDFDRASAPDRMRVHALAKAVGVTSKELIAALGELGVSVKSASSTVVAADRDRFLDAVAGQGKRDDVPAAAVETAGEKEKAGEPTGAAKNESAKKSTKRTAKRTAGKKAAPAKKADDVDVAETIVAEAPDVPETPEVAETAGTTAATEPTAKTTAKGEGDDAEPKKATRRSRSRRAVKRTVSKAAAPAKKADDVDVAEPIAEAAADTSAGTSSDLTEDDPLVEVVPPITPPPAEPTFAIPVFMAPEPVTVVSADTSDASADAIAEAVDDSADDHDDHDNDADSDGDRTGGGRGSDDQGSREPRPRRRRRGRGRGRGAQDGSGDGSGNGDGGDASDAKSGSGSDSGNGDRGVAKHDDRNQPAKQDRNTDAAQDDDEPEVAVVDEPVAIKGSTRLEAQRRRRADRRAESRKRHVISEAEFLARRESVERTMVVRERRRHDGNGMVTQVGVLEDDLLVEHFVTSDTQTSIIGDIYLGRVQNVLPSMEAAFIDIGTDRNGVLYSADVNWRAFGSSGRSRRIEHALKAGDQVLVQATKDPLGHKGARLSMQISLAGRFLVYVPGGHSAGISRKLPEPERKRLKEILKEVTPSGSGTIIRTAAEGVSKDAIEADVQRLEGLWQDIDKRAGEAKARKGAKPETMYEEPNMLIKVVRDLFNEDFSRLVVEGDKAWGIVRSYVDEVAPDLADRLQRYRPEQHGGEDVFAHHRIDEQLAKALDRKVWLPSGGTLIIERTEAMTVVDVNTGKFTGAGGNLEETVTRNNLEAAEEIVRQMRLRDLGGMIVVDFIDMVLPENQDLVLRRLKEALGRDRTRHEVSEVTSLGLVQMTRKRLGTGLLETFSTTCEACDGRGLVIHVDPVDHEHEPQRGRPRGRRTQAPPKHPVAEAMRRGDHDDDHKDDHKHGHEDDHRSDQSASTKDFADEQGTNTRLDDGSRGAGSGDREQSGGRSRRRGRRGSRRGGEGRSGDEQRRDDQRSDDRNRDDQRGDDQRRDERRRDDRNRDDRRDHDAADEPMSAEDRAVDESVNRAEAEESRPPRRRGRRRASSRPGSDEGQRRGADERSTEDSGERRREASRGNREEHADVGDALARVAANAVAEARDKDPDEPSDDRYVSRSARRRRRRRVVHAGQATQDEAGREDSGREDSGREESDREDSGRKDAGRGNRGSGREQRTEVSDTPDRTVSVESKPVKGADEAPAEPGTYEEALAAFEKSPRRNRPTRGRSRSDHAPKPEDFGQPASDAKGSNEKSSDQKGSDEKGTDQKNADRKGSGQKSSDDKNSGRKRSAKKTAAPKNSGGKDDAPAMPADAPKATPEKAAASDSAASTSSASFSGESERPARRRGRRRAVRRVTSQAGAESGAADSGQSDKSAAKKNAPKKAASKKAQSSAPKGEGADGSVAKQDDAGQKPRRGRRRAVRRVSRG
ncbi:translation initiation factor IF-2 N-terminal domain-containing protein [Corynebacterium xerosis]|uniref:translation initiation factor IF-2 N-terminal domain-containing protein n=1 Tax=Corynebacterium xerosis TaxID=1725 RepID=UPI0007678DCA|nr:translation initiation factor IF-2 N-terminal domain-containing protein [Corynebacterium xerosis]SQB94722.1 ribonuclease, Rne/Rng family [Clostridium paraputrificum]